MKAPTLTSHTAGWNAAKRAVRTGYTASNMPHRTVRRIAADLAREHMQQTMETRPKLTQRQGVSVFYAYFCAFMDNTASQFELPHIEYWD